MYTVKEVSYFSGITIKTLHHYHKIGLVLPCGITEGGYRLYGTQELERLQQVLLYREMDFSLKQIRTLLDAEEDRPSILKSQEKLLSQRKRRLETILETLRLTIQLTEKGEPMEPKAMFEGFEREEQWKEALKEQNEHLKATYDFDMLENSQIDLSSMNEMAAEATAFMNAITQALRAGTRHDDEQIATLLREHLSFLAKQGHVISPEDFAAQNRFFLSDDFHGNMLESMQVGLSYYLAAAADFYAARFIT